MQKLTKTEEEIMQWLWHIGRGTVSDVLEKMGDPKPPHSTVSSVVRILEKKGYVGHKAYGKTHEYFPLIDKDAYASSSLSDVLSNYFDGSAQRLVSHLIEDKRLKEKDLEDILKRFSEMND
jgi:predicted transcriptional regulator